MIVAPSCEGGMVKRQLVTSAFILVTCMLLIQPAPGQDRKLPKIGEIWAGANAEEWRHTVSLF
jgi:hypothetical protein